MTIFLETKKKFEKKLFSPSVGMGTGEDFLKKIKIFFLKNYSECLFFKSDLSQNFMMQMQKRCEMLPEMMRRMNAKYCQKFTIYSSVRLNYKMYSIFNHLHPQRGVDF